MVINYATREIDFKVVYCGAGQSGKTTNLEWIHSRCRPEQRGNLMSLETSAERTLYFDFLPSDLGMLDGFETRLRLCTIPGPIRSDAARKLLHGVDGVCFVVDSQRARLEANLERLANLREALAARGCDLGQLPHVFQYNKRDLPGAMPVAELDARLDRDGAPSFEAEAVRGVGVFETLHELGRTIVTLHRGASDRALAS